ncbi:MAG: hypothetical protein M3256_10655 [Actinomycetota bacterium]|nr:hypothetical protein [Actinomycetota bacterium]
MGAREVLRNHDQGRHPRAEHLRRITEPYLDADESVSYLFFGVRRYIWGNLWVVAVTDRSILIVEASPGTWIWQPLRPEFAFRLPRSTRIGPRYGYMWYIIDGERIAIGGKEAQRAIAAADAEIGFPASDSR